MISTLFSGLLKYAVAIMAALLLALAGYNFYLRNVVAGQEQILAANVVVIDTQNRELKAGVEREKKAAVVLKKYQADNAALANKQKESNDRLEQALEANKDWANQPVPDGIAEWLRNN
jgi:Tfp pilus assembly protein PilO